MIAIRDSDQAETRPAAKELTREAATERSCADEPDADRLPCPLALG
jgi:hypothetical protein